jgi:hypothetical protein
MAGYVISSLIMNAVKENNDSSLVVWQKGGKLFEGNKESRKFLGLVGKS